MPEVNKDWIDEELSAKWEKLKRVKDEVSRALELARKEKVIGHSLDAAVSILPTGELRELIESEGAALKDALIVSALDVVMELPAGAYESQEIPGLKVAVSKADGEKCERCWHISASVGEDTSNPTVCAKCSTALGPQKS